MSKREKIIILVMILAVTYGVYAIFFTSTSKTVKKGSSGKATDLIMSLTAEAENLAMEDTSQTDSYILKRASAKWSNNPFLGFKNIVKSDIISSPDKEIITGSELAYSGYLEMGDTKMAIINGMEYEVGDTLADGGFIIKNIFSDRVLIQFEGKTGSIMLTETDGI